MKEALAQERTGGRLPRFQEFLQTESASGAILLACTFLALAWANSPWSAGYFDLWQTGITLGAPQFGLQLDLHHWINDGLMALFFFVVGLEIKRELLVGELAQLKQALLPIIGALGGMLAPALIYLALNLHSGSAQGWGIPVATDIAFALALLTLLGPRVPTGLKVFLLALAIVDDLGAVLVIALFYTHGLNLLALAAAAAGLLAAALLNRAAVSRPLPYVLLGLFIWVAVLLSGVHATVAGVLLALCIPARARIDATAFSRRCRELLDRFEQTLAPPAAQADSSAGLLRLSSEQQELLAGLEASSERAMPPLDRMEHSLHPWIAYLVMPLFALSNAGVALPASLGPALLDPVSIGVILGLLLGKPLGVSAFVWLAVRFKLAELPQGVGWRHVVGAAVVCGIGFTMSLFIANLAFAAAPRQLDGAKLGILLASAVAGLGGYILLRLACRPAASPISAGGSPPPVR